jgi:hypothetical protein
MRNPIATDGAAVTLVQVQTTLDNWYMVQLRQRRRLKTGFQRNGRRDERRTTNTGTQNRSNRGRQMRYSRQLGLKIMYQYTNSGKVYGDMPPPIDERATLRHVGRNTNGIRPYPKDAGMISLCSNLRGLHAGSVRIGEAHVEWQKYEWWENTYQTLRKTCGDAIVEFITSKVKFEGRYKPGGAPQPPLWVPGHTT